MSKAMRSLSEEPQHPLQALASRLYSRGFMDAYKELGHDPWDTCTDAVSPAMEELEAYEGDGIKAIEDKALSRQSDEVNRLKNALEVAIVAMQKNIAFAQRKDEHALVHGIETAQKALKEQS